MKEFIQETIGSLFGITFAIFLFVYLMVCLISFGHNRPIEVLVDNQVVYSGAEWRVGTYSLGNATKVVIYKDRGQMILNKVYISKDVKINNK